MGTLKIIRGYPGSGCTTLAKELASGGVRISIEDHLPRGAEHEDVIATRAIGLAKENVDVAVEQAVRDGQSPIVVEGPILRLWELRTIVSVAEKAGYSVEVVNTSTTWARDPKTCAERTHYPLRADTWQHIVEVWEIPATRERIRAALSPEEQERCARWLATALDAPLSEEEISNRWRYLFENFPEELADLQDQGFVGNGNKGRVERESWVLRAEAAGYQPPQLVPLAGLQKSKSLEAARVTVVPPTAPATGRIDID